MIDKPSEVSQRIDKWLWAARFFKTRSLAAEAVEGGRVEINGRSAKPAKEVKPGDRLDIGIGDLRWNVVVRGLSAQRRPAPEARLLFEESEESLAARQAQIERKKVAAEPGEEIKGRPTKRDRRRLQRFFG
ncbi:MAG: RNA-binding S4 domain-containing protein [Rhodocyclaceae bacterium]